jgi:hypothetical protein
MAALWWMTKITTNCWSNYESSFYSFLYFGLYSFQQRGHWLIIDESASRNRTIIYFASLDRSTNLWIGLIDALFMGSASLKMSTSAYHCPVSRTVSDRCVPKPRSLWISRKALNCECLRYWQRRARAINKYSKKLTPKAQAKVR